MKKLLKITGSKTLSKDSQKDINGGIRPILIQTCAQQCARPGATGGEKCGIGTHCPGECDGRGGYAAY